MKRTKMKEFRSLEIWHTRYGNSPRAVTRNARGQFVDNISLNAIL